MIKDIFAVKLSSWSFDICRDNWNIIKYKIKIAYSDFIINFTFININTFILIYIIRYCIQSIVLNLNCNLSRIYCDFGTEINQKLENNIFE